MSYALTIQTIQQIKDSVERPEICARLGTLEPSCSKRLRAARYIDGATKIMVLLRDDLTADDIEVYEQLCESACDRPNHCCGDRLDVARELWDYVISLDRVLCQKRIRSTPKVTYPRPPCLTTGMEPPKPTQLVPTSAQPPATNLCQPPLAIVWYPTTLVPAYRYDPGWAWLPVPTRSDQGISPVVWTRG